MITTVELARRRLHNQRLDGPAGLAKSSLGQRTEGLTDSDIDSLLADGRILRTHILRPTWHFVLPADIRWMMQLTGPRVELRIRSRTRALDLDERRLTEAYGVITDALAGGGRLTRRQIGSRLQERGISTDVARLTHIVMHAELNSLICSGGLDGKEQTYALFDDRVPPTPVLTPDEALAELVRRYFTSHGPSSIRDFTWSATAASWRCP
ncbi:hypothetical protein BH24CHL6_BH24CHL6_01050 [soil metagenome]